jgi:hypothetical protein
VYVRIQTTDEMPDQTGPDGGLKRLADTIAGHPGFAGLFALRSEVATRASLITLWHTEDDARLAPDRTREELGPRRIVPTTDLLYEVRDDDAGVSADATPTAAGMMWAAGPMSEETAAIGRRARRERIAPAIRSVPGVVRMISLFQPDTQQPCTLTLLTSAGVGIAVREAFDAIELQPDEQWLRIPARIELFSVEAAVTDRAEHAVDPRA